MPKFFYTATSLQGESKTGSAEAQDEKNLAKNLRKEGYVLISASKEKSKSKIDILSSIGGVPLKEKLFFTRNFRLMIKAGVPLPKSLEMLSSQANNPKLKKVLLEVRNDIIKGKKLSDALAERPDVFSELFCNMIKVGEETGNLEQVLKNLNDQMEKTYKLKARVKGALIYPVVIIIAMMGIGILMLVTVVPRLSQTFDDLGIELPFTTRLIVKMAGIMTDFWYFFVIAFIFLAIVIRLAMKTSKGGNIIDKAVLKIPVISSIIKGSNTAYTARTLSALINSGVPIVKSLKIVSKTLDNHFFREAANEAAKEVKKGTKLSEAIAPYSSLYPFSFSEMIAVGEETGETSEILEKLADFSEDEVDNLTKNLTSVIEPVIMIIIGTAVGFFAVSMIQPMYSMLGGI
jgi:type IV pilus assembly protein PilC